MCACVCRKNARLSLTCLPLRLTQRNLKCTQETELKYLERAEAGAERKYRCVATENAIRFAAMGARRKEILAAPALLLVFTVFTHRTAQSSPLLVLWVGTCDCSPTNLQTH